MMVQEATIFQYFSKGLTFHKKHNIACFAHQSKPCIYIRMDESARHLRAVEEAYVTLQEDFHLRGFLYTR